MSTQVTDDKLINAPISAFSSFCLCIIDIRAGCRLSMLYAKGIIMMMAAGGAVRERRASRFTNDARIVAGRWLTVRQH